MNRVSQDMKIENSVIEAIRGRRSIRQFTRETVSDERVDLILESGVWAPSGMEETDGRTAFS